MSVKKGEVKAQIHGPQRSGWEEWRRSTPLVKFITFMIVVTALALVSGFTAHWVSKVFSAGWHLFW